jgi:plastocyanin
VTATEKEYSITLSTMTFKPGVYTFEVQNTGTMPHDLTIAGPGVAQQSSPTVQAGGSAQLTVTLQAGTYELWCSIPGHKQLGMDLKIQVT